MLTAEFADGTTQIIGSINNPSPQTPFTGFFGFISDKPFAKIRYQSNSQTGNSEGFTLDNVKFRRQFWLPYNWWRNAIALVKQVVGWTKKPA